MAKGEHYLKPPITEAIIDLRVDLPESTTIDDLERIHVGLETAYPTKKKRIYGEVRAQIGDHGAVAAATSKQDGLLFSTQDGTYVFQARLDGFTMSRLAPYDRWEPFRDEARRLWDVYRAVAKPTKVTRLAIRYVNRLDLPLPVADLKQYLRTVPEVSPELPQNLAGYFMQLRIPLDDIKSFLLVNQAIIDPARPGVASVVLDNDIFRVDDIPADEQGLWDFFEVLRQRKNDVFEASIANQARELFK
jgi:uncharacterized protein (TIGR04255 family)